MPSIRAQHAQNVILEYQLRLAKSKTGLPPLRPPPLRENNGEPIRVGILGGGIAGLYAALLIDYLGPESGIAYDILEANPDRIGGRLYTHRFSDSPNDYFVSDPVVNVANSNALTSLFRMQERCATQKFHG